MAEIIPFDFTSNPHWDSDRNPPLIPPVILLLILHVMPHGVLLGIAILPVNPLVILRVGFIFVLPIEFHLRFHMIFYLYVYMLFYLRF